MTQPISSELSDLSLGLGIEEDVLGAVDTGRDRLDLHLNGDVIFVHVTERVRLLAGVDDGLGERGGADAAAGEAVIDLGAKGTRLGSEPLDEFDFLVGVARPAVDRYHGWHPERLDDLQVAADVAHAELDRLQAGGP